LPVESATGLCPECLKTSAAPASTPKESRAEPFPTTDSVTPGSGPAGASQTRTFVPRNEPATTTAPPALTHGALPLAPAGYEIVRELGSGGMGIVYLAREIAPQRLVAMKFLQRPNNHAAFERFLVEVRALALLDHPHIVGILSSDFLRADPFFTTEFVPGGSLSKKVDSDGPFESVAAARLMASAAHAVHEAHRANVIHRDLKPSNILLGEDGTPRIADFGLAKRLDRDDGLTTSGGPLGTPRYMAPEQTGGEQGQIDARTDVYGLGATLYFLVTGHPPFSGPHEESIRQIQSEPPVPPRSHRPELPRELEGIILKCLKKDRAQRYSSAKALAIDLERFVAGQRPEAPVLSWPRRSAQRIGRHRRAIGVGALALVAVIAIAALLWPEPRAIDPVEEMRKALRDGRSYTILGESGLPKYYRWRLGAGQFGKSTTGEEACYYASIGHSLLEVIPDDAGTDSYRLSMDVRHVGSTLSLHHPGREKEYSYLGPYLGHAERVTSDGRPLHAFFGFTYSDIQPNAGPPDKPFYVVRVKSVGITPHNNEEQQIHRGHIGGKSFTGSNLEPGTWRSFRIDVSPNGVRVDWKARGADNYELLWKLREKSIQSDYGRFMESLVAKWPGVGVAVPEWSPRMAAGIWSYGAAVSIKNIVIEPLNRTNEDINGTD
jgi:serine/threonine-protein kinase